MVDTTETLAQALVCQMMRLREYQICKCHPLLNQTGSKFAFWSRFAALRAFVIAPFLIWRVSKGVLEAYTPPWSETKPLTAGEMAFRGKYSLRINKCKQKMPVRVDNLMEKEKAFSKNWHWADEVWNVFVSILVFLLFAVAKLHLFRNHPMYVHAVDAYRVIKEGRSAVILLCACLGWTEMWLCRFTSTDLILHS